MVLSRIKAFYSNSSNARRASFWFLIVSFLNKASGFLLTPFFTRLLSPDSYGLVGVYVSWLSVLTPIITLNIASSGYNKSLLDHSDDLDSYTASVLVLDLFSTALFFGLFLAFHSILINVSGLPFWMWCYMFVYVALTQSLNFWIMQQRFKYKYIASSVVTVITSIVGPVCAVVLLSLHAFANEVAVRILGVGSFYLIFGLFLIVVILSKAKYKIKFHFWKEALSISLPLVPHTLAMNILSGSDKIMISNMINNSASAKYALSHSIAGIVGTFWTAIDASFTPWTMVNYKQGHYKRINTYSIKILAVYSFLCFIPICIAPEFLMIMGSHEYQDAIWCLAPTLLGIMYIAVYSVYVNVEYAIGKTYFVMIGSIMAAGLNLVLNFLFIPIFGYTAAAYTTLFSYFALGLFHCLVLRLVLKKRIFNDVVIFSFMGATTLLGLVFQITYVNYVARYAILIIILAVAVFLRKKIIKVIRN